MIFSEVWSESRLDVLDVFNWIYLEYITEQSGVSLVNLVNLFNLSTWTVKNMIEMKTMIPTRPSYPSDKFTFNIADLTKDKVIQFFSIDLNLNEQYDVDAVLEDSKRNFMNSF